MELSRVMTCLRGYCELKFQDLREEGGAVDHLGNGDGFIIWLGLADSCRGVNFRIDKSQHQISTQFVDFECYPIGSRHLLGELDYLCDLVDEFIIKG